MDWSLHRLEQLTSADYDRCLALMEPGRQAQVRAMGHDLHRGMTVLGEWVVKCELARRAGCPVEEIRLSRTPAGKPMAEGLDLWFSISHTGDRLAVAFDTRPVGIDIEVLRPVSQPLAQRICTPGDWRYLLAGRAEFEPENEEQRRRFFAIWTAKEALLKREGGSVLQLKQVDYATIPTRHIWQEDALVTLVCTEA